MSTTAGAGGGPREDEDDLDLLTRTEAGIRLAEEIERVRDQLSAIQSVGAGSDALLDRLEALTAAQARIGRPDLAGQDHERFFGFPHTSGSELNPPHAAPRERAL
jgi:hypothetical protein